MARNILDELFVALDWIRSEDLEGAAFKEDRSFFRKFVQSPPTNDSATNNSNLEYSREFDSTARDMNVGISGTVFTAAAEDSVGEFIDCWLKFTEGQSGHSPVVKLAISYVLYLAASPGSTSVYDADEELFLLFLAKNIGLKQPVFELSKRIDKEGAKQNSGEFGKSLRDVFSTGSWEPWLRYFLELTRQQAIWYRAWLVQLGTAYETLVQAAVKLNANRRKQLVELLLRRPVCSHETITAAGIAWDRNTATSYLKVFAEAGVLQIRKIGKFQVFVNFPLLELFKADPGAD
ncbi:hypothetical protein IEN85_16300 [Pelagicoccus sp. NFK12]|uniref:Adenylyltransferase SoFic-like C-terminal domain-containing protein n=1 Tax=Pelagicoccus enzymogenes TaxID=2773457 RepID=A0A927IGC9_9BACT|nr:hypothetical protein [Pelagicoccus enzymogenes]MBD5781062.1 hypothetical protein [Pelagicoccus enzymogenes]